MDERSEEKPVKCALLGFLTSNTKVKKNNNVVSMDKNDMNRVVDVDTTDVTAFKSNSTGGTSNLTSKAMEGINSTLGSYNASDVPYGVSDSADVTMVATDT
ncbi:hypothetical protein Tco_1271572 [Tanacetum coccineum]